MAKEDANPKVQGFRYVVVGGSSALLELLLFQLLYGVFHWEIAASNVSAIVLSTMYNFILNRSFTFKQSGSPVRSLILYIILFAFNTSFTTWAIGALASLGVIPIFAKLGTMCCVAVWNFFLYRLVIFK